MRIAAPLEGNFLAALQVFAYYVATTKSVLRFVKGGASREDPP